MRATILQLASYFLFFCCNFGKLLASQGRCKDTTAKKRITTRILQKGLNNKTTTRQVPSEKTKVVAIDLSHGQKAEDKTKKDTIIVIDLLDSDDEPAEVDRLLRITPIIQSHVELTATTIRKSGQRLLNGLLLEDPGRHIQLPDLEDYISSRFISIKSLKDLLQNTYLNDEIVNAYMSQLVRVDFEAAKAFDAISSLRTAGKFGRNKLELCDGFVYLWPLFHRDLRHWTLLSIEQVETRLVLKHYDSLTLSLSSLQEVGVVLKHLAEKVQPCLSLENIAIISTPQQSNNVDCGVYVLAIAKMLILGLKFDRETQLNIEDIRSEIAIELISNITFAPSSIVSK